MPNLGPSGASKDPLVPFLVALVGGGWILKLQKISPNPSLTSAKVRKQLLTEGRLGEQLEQLKQLAAATPTQLLTAVVHSHAQQEWL